MLLYAMICYAMICYAMLCYVMLWYAMVVRYAMMCYAPFCYVIQSYTLGLHEIIIWITLESFLDYMLYNLGLYKIIFEGKKNNSFTDGIACIL